MLQINYQKLWKIFLFSKLLITKRKNEKYRKMVICLTWGDFRPPIPFLIFFKLWYSWSAQNSTLESAIAVNFRYYRPTLTYKEGTNLDMVPPSEKRRQSNSALMNKEEKKMLHPFWKKRPIGTPTYKCNKVAFKAPYLL